MLLCSYLVAFCGHQVSCPENIPCTCCLSGFVSTRSLLIYTMTVFPFCVLPKHQVNRPNCCICAHGFAVTKTLLRNSLGFFSSPKLGQISGRFIPIAYVCSVFLNLPTIWQVVWWLQKVIQTTLTIWNSSCSEDEWTKSGILCEQTTNITYIG